MELIFPTGCISSKIYIIDIKMQSLSKFCIRWNIKPIIVLHIFGNCFWLQNFNLRPFPYSIDEVSKFYFSLVTLCIWRAMPRVKVISFLFLSKIFVCNIVDLRSCFHRIYDYLAYYINKFFAYFLLTVIDIQYWFKTSNYPMRKRFKFLQYHETLNSYFSRFRMFDLINFTAWEIVSKWSAVSINLTTFKLSGVLWMNYLSNRRFAKVTSHSVWKKKQNSLHCFLLSLAFLQWTH